MRIELSDSSYKSDCRNLLSHKNFSQGNKANMEQIIIQVKDKFKAKMLIELLNDMNFITDIKTFKQDTDTNQKTDFFSFAGIWADRDVSLTSVRQNAWPRQNL